MKLYLEIFELLDENEMRTRQPQQLRVEVANKDEAIELYKQFKVLFSNCKYVARIHECYHDEGKECKVEIIEEVM